MTSLSVRSASPADIPVLQSLILELARYEKLDHTVRSRDETLRKALFESPPSAEAFLAEIEGLTVGFALFFPTYSTFLGESKLFLEDLFVREEWRGKGAGRALLSAICRLAKERGHARVEWYVLDWNVSARNFYLSLGADIHPQWRVVQMDGVALERLARDTTESSP